MTEQTIVQDLDDASRLDLNQEMTRRVRLACLQPLLGASPDYLVTPALLPGQDGQALPAFGVTVAIPSLSLGEKIQATAVVSNLWLSQQEVNTVVKQMVDALLEARGKQSSGLILPS